MAFRGPPRWAAICTVHPSRTFGCLCVSGPRGGGRSWHLPLPSAVPGPEHGARRVLSDAALSASWCPAPRGPHASAFPSAVAPWASGRRFHLLPLSPLGGSSSGSRSEELPASAPSESTRCRRRRRSGLPPPRLPTRGPRRRLCLRGFCPSGPLQKPVWTACVTLALFFASWQAAASLPREPDTALSPRWWWVVPEDPVGMKRRLWLSAACGTKATFGAVQGPRCPQRNLPAPP